MGVALVVVIAALCLFEPLALAEGPSEPAAALKPAASSDDRLGRLESALEAEKARSARIERELEILRRRQFDADEAQSDDGGAVGAASTAGGSSGDPVTRTAGVGRGGAGTQSLPDRSKALRDEQGGYAGIYAKPFLTSLGPAHLGGYMDWEYRVYQQGKDATLRLPRFVPFIYADVTEHVKVAAELEFEFGGISGETDGEVKLEFAFVDYVVSEAIALRAGQILIPLGKFNLIHDSPINDLTDRPLVDRFVIPTTFSEAGVGLYGSIYPAGEWKLDYELYIVNGFRGLVRDADSPTGFESRLLVDDGTRDARPDVEQDINGSPAGVGRIALSPFLGLEAAVSAHVGNYDEHAGGLLGVIWAVDATVQVGRFLPVLQGLEFLGEFAQLNLERNDVARASGVPRGFLGAYAQVNYHIMPDALKSLVPAIFGDESTFTFVFRYDHLDLDGNKKNRLNPGLNFRPTEETVLKFDYQFNFDDWSRGRVNDDAFLISIATYF